MQESFLDPPLTRSCYDITLTLDVDFKKGQSESRSVMSDSCDPVHYTVHGILQARILEWVAFLFSRGSSQPRDRTQVSCIAGNSLPAEPHGKFRNVCVCMYIYVCVCVCVVCVCVSCSVVSNSLRPHRL